MPFLNPSTATATVAANTNVVTLSGLDLTTVTIGMTISFGSRSKVTGDQYLIAAVNPSGTSGGTITTLDSLPAMTNQPFIIDTTGFLGTDATYLIQMYVAQQNVLNTLFGPNTNLYSGSRQLAFDKTVSTALSRLIYSTGGRTWGDLAHRTLTYTPTGGAAVSAEVLSLRAFLDGTTATDAVLIDLTTGGVDVRKASTTMASAATVDLSSAPTGKVAITGAVTITSFGPGKHLERLVRFVDGGGVLTHNATSLILLGGANIVTRPGDCLHVTSDGSGNWRVHAYARADGTPLVANGIRFDVAQTLTAPQQAQARANAGLNSQGQTSGRNRIRNGAFGINLRNVSGTVTLGAGVYGHDGFKAGANGCTYAFAKNNGVITFNITAGTLLQLLEGALYVVEGGTYTASWVGTAQARVYQGTATGPYAAGPLTVLGLAPETNTAVEWGVGTLALPQFEPGTIATMFERRDDEGARNYRYQQPVIGCDGVFFSTTQWYGTLRMSPMRDVPTLVLLNGTNALNEYLNNANRNVTSFIQGIFSNIGGALLLNTSTANSGARADLSFTAVMMRSEL